MSAGPLLLAVGLALLAAWALRPTAPAEETAPVQIRLPPILLAGTSREDAETILSRLQPSFTPHLNPLGWTVSWPSVDIPTDYGTAHVELPPVELPLIPRGEVLRALQQMRPQLVETPNGLAVQVTAIIPT